LTHLENKCHLQCVEVAGVIAIILQEDLPEPLPLNLDLNSVM